jgi:hypothetical protein
MKSILVIAAFFGLFERCDHLPVEQPWHGSGHDHGSHAGDEDDAGPGAAADCGVGAAAGLGEAGRGGAGTSAAGTGGAGVTAAGTGGASAAGAGGAAGSAPLAIPQACSDALKGLFADRTCNKLAAGVSGYRPEFELWSDGASKERFVYLPPDTQIDTSNADRWDFPQGTRFYKTFSVDGQRVETRVLEKTAQAPSIDSWTFTTYGWQADQRNVVVADAAGAKNWLGTGHDIPALAQCKSCHTMPGLDAINGFGAIQLNHSDPSGISLRTLLDDMRLINRAGSTPNVTLENAQILGDETTQAALGYLHANCGGCHGGPTPRLGLKLWSTVLTEPVSDPGIISTAVCQCLTKWTGRTNTSADAYTQRVAPGHAAISGIIGRMSVRGMGEQMPPLGTSVVDHEGVEAVSAWIASLDANMCDAAPPTCVAATK